MSHKKPPEGYITIPDAARMAGVAPATMYTWTLYKGEIPYRAYEAGTRRFYLIKKSDMERFIEKKNASVGKRRRAKEYEIVVISLGQLSVLFKTNSLMELSHMYIRLLEREHKYIRVRADGELLTIHESDKLGNTFHPRTKRRAI